jgi:hypothetical protein
MQNGKVGEGDVISRKTTYSLPYLHKNFGIVNQRLQQSVQNLE